MNTNLAIKIDKNAVAESFSKAAKSYDQFAQLQRDIGEQLLNQIDESTYINILDLGCGTGYFTEKLRKYYSKSNITCFDLSSAMLEQVVKKELPALNVQQGDIDALPFNGASFDLIFSNLVLQWSENLTNCLQQLSKILLVGGKLHFSTLLNGSLHELTQAWKQVDNFPHTNEFLTLDNISKQIQQVGFSNVEINTEMRTLEYDNVIELMHALKGIGANHVHGYQGTKVTGRKLIKLLEKGYVPFINEIGKYSLTYHVCYVEAEK